MKKESIVDDYYNNGYVVIDDVISDKQNKNILKELNKFNKNEFHNISNENKFLNKNNFNGFMYIVATALCKIYKVPVHGTRCHCGVAANEIILRRTLKEELIAERQAPMGGRRERAGGNLGL